MAKSSSPTVRRRRLALELRRLREAAGLSRDEAIEELGFSESKLSRIEGAKGNVSRNDVLAMCHLYRADPELSKELVEIARLSKQKGWWQAYSVPDELHVYIGLEADASRIQVYDPELIPGLLQTEAYARALGEETAESNPVETVESSVQVRQTRQEALDRDNPLQLWVVLNEAVLKRQVGGPKVTREQLGYLVEVSLQANITIQVLPFTAGAHPAMSYPFTILGFPEPNPDVVYLEGLTNDIYAEEDAEVDLYKLVFNRLQAKAANPKDSIIMIKRTANDLP